MNLTFQSTVLGLSSAPIPTFLKSSNQIKPEALRPSFGMAAEAMTEENQKVYKELNKLLRYVPYIKHVEVKDKMDVWKGDDSEKKNIQFQGVRPFVALAILIGLRNQTLRFSIAEGVTAVFNDEKYKIRFTSMRGRS